MITAVYLGERSLGVASGRPAGRGVELTHARTIPLPADFAALDVDARASLLRKAVAETGADARTCVLVVPRGQAILRSFTLPSGSPEEIRRMVGFQLEKDLPLPLNDVKYSYSTSTAPDGRIQVSAAAVPNDTLGRLVDPLVLAGCRVSGAVVGSFGLPHLLPHGSAEGALVVHLADGAAEIAILESGGVALSRTVPAEPPDAEALATEIERALRSHQAAGGHADIARVLVAGEDEAAGRIAADLKRVLSRVVEAVAPNGTVTRRPDVRIPSSAAAAAGVCVGMLRDRGAVPDVLNPPVYHRRLRVSRAMAAAIAAAVVVVGTIVAAQVHLTGLRAELTRINGDLAKLKPQADRVTKLRSNLSAVHLWQDHRFAWIDLVAALNAKADRSKLYLTSLTAGETGVVIVKGRATDDKHVTQYIADLQKGSSLFREVVADSIVTTVDPGAYKHDFTLRITVGALAPPPRK